ncbi:MAG: hypothetical protein AB1444_05520 [Spirochaetota bacterium]
MPRKERLLRHCVLRNDGVAVVSLRAKRSNLSMMKGEIASSLALLAMTGLHYYKSMNEKINCKIYDLKIYYSLQ